MADLTELESRIAALESRLQTLENYIGYSPGAILRTMDQRIKRLEDATGVNERP